MENIIESDIELNMGIIEIADKAFGDNKSGYDKGLIEYLKKCQKSIKTNQ
ncbi:MAG: hypothetical protein HFJ48_05745 [Clostridia bacterium]|nr:hypothetical protein [Clostridia bacterium]